MKLSDAFPRNRSAVKALAGKGIRTVEEAKARLHDVRLTHGIGKVFINRLLNLKVESKTYPHRQICGLCHRVSPVDFFVPNHIWEAVVHSSRLQDIHCLNCFIERADEKLVAWDKEIQFFPVSMHTHIHTFFNVTDK